MKIINNFQKNLYKFVMGGQPMDKEIKDKDAAVYNEQLENEIWYEGNASLLNNFYAQFRNTDVKYNYFWSKSYPYINIRKIHSGLPAMIVDKLIQITIRDGFNLNAEKEKDDERLQIILEDNEFEDILKDSTISALVNPDGAFKIDFDKDVSKFPILTYVGAKNVEIIKKYGRIQEIIFKTYYNFKGKDYCLKERRQPGKIVSELYEVKDNELKSVPLNSIPDTEGLKEEVPFKRQDIIYAIPFKIYDKSIFSKKKDIFDAIDETLSIMGDSVRDSRVERYIPKDKLPVDVNTGEPLIPDGMDSRYIITEPSNKDVEEKIQIVQPDISFEGYRSILKDYIDQALVGILSPSTMGLDKSTERNAEDRREQEKTSIFTRTDIVRSLENAIQTICERLLQMEDEIAKRTPKDYGVVIEFSEYASLSFENKVETMSKAKQVSLLPNSVIIEELYGDTKSEEEKQQIVADLLKEGSPLDINSMFPKE